MTSYQKEINRVALDLCLCNPSLLNDRKALLETSRKKLDETGYCYKEGKSRSKHLNPSSSPPPASKRRNTTQDIRLSKISEIEEQVKDKKEQI